MGVSMRIQDVTPGHPKASHLCLESVCLYFLRALWFHFDVEFDQLFKSMLLNF